MKVSTPQLQTSHQIYRRSSEKKRQAPTIKPGASPKLYLQAPADPAGVPWAGSEPAKGRCQSPSPCQSRWGAGEHPKSVQAGSVLALTPSPPATRVTWVARACLEWQNRAWGTLCLKARHWLSSLWIFIPWQNRADNARLAPRYPERLLVIQCLLQSIKSSSTEILADLETDECLRGLHLCRTGQLRSKGQVLLPERCRFPGLIPIAAEISSNHSLGAASAFRLLFRAGILLWAHS